MKVNQDYDAIVIGSGMGGMSAAAMLAKNGYKVLILEAAAVPGGCSSSYYRKGFTFESGATTLIGFDENQPLWKLEKETGITIPKVEISPSMSVNIDGKTITRYKDREKWIEEAGRVFGNPHGQRKFWAEALKVSDIVWKVSLKNPFFPPRSLKDWTRLAITNSPIDAKVLPYALKSVQQIMEKFEVDTPLFRRFVDEQLMITAQSKSTDTPFLFGAAGLTYTNYSNYYVPGGLLEMIKSIQNFVEQNRGELHTKEAVVKLLKVEDGFRIETKKKNLYKTPIVVSNIPIWNMKDITEDGMQDYFTTQSAEFDTAWGAITLGIATTDTYPNNMSLHHQLHLGENEAIPHTNSESIFVSFSERGDTKRAPKSTRTLNVSCHADPELWFSLKDDYDTAKEKVESYIVEVLKQKLPGFKESSIKTIHTATPVTWQKWVYRKKGRVGGIPQSMARSLLKWVPNATPFSGLYLVGDTTYPGQGIPGVTLSGLNVYWRIKQNQK